MAENKTVVKTTEKSLSASVIITPPKFELLKLGIQGSSLLVQHGFSMKQRQILVERHKEGSRAKTKTKKMPRDFDAEYEAARHISEDGWDGIPCSAFRNGLISACRVAGFAMTRAKLAIFVEPDGQSNDGIPLVRITKGQPEPFIAQVRNSDGSVDLRNRPRWKAGWEAILTIRYDADQFDGEAVVNLVLRLGQQVGIQEGRPDSKKSCGQGWGLFELKN